MILVKSPTFGNRSLGLTLLLSLAILSLTSATVAGEGACCFPDDICVEGVDNADCNLIGGFYLGDGSACDGDEDGDGVVGCDDLCPGTPSGTPVDENGCPTIGACCFADVGVCIDGLDEDTCVSIDGDYVGSGSFCAEPETCPPICEGDANGDGLVDPLDSGFVLARFGCPVGTGDPSCDDADQNGDGLVDPLDSGFVLARFGDCPEAPPECSKDADCDDGDVCTDDACDSETGCSNTAVEDCCNDDADCAEGESCIDNACVAPCTDDASCDDGDLCTTDTCDRFTGFCSNDAADCDDLDACTVDSCDAATGDCMNDPLCDDGDLCTTDSCADGVCTNDAVACNPGQTCDPADGNCVDIECVEDMDCDDGLACTFDDCSNGMCVYTNLDSMCDDALFCTGAGTCDPDDADADADGCVFTGDPCGGTTPVCDEANNECAACVDDADCDDDVACTDDTCEVDGSCTNTAVDGNCSDPDFCDGVDACDPANEDADAEGCVGPGNPCPGMDPNAPVCEESDDSCSACQSNSDCDDDLSCTDDTCDGGTGACFNTNNNANCADPDFCDGVDACDPANADADANGCGAPGNPCSGTTPVCDEATESCSACIANAECDDAVACTIDACNGVTGACSNTADDTLCPGTDDPTDATLCDVSLGCVECLVDGDCDDLLFCTGVETCDTTTGSCDASPGDPCSGTTPICDEGGDVCNACVNDAECVAIGMTTCNVDGSCS